MEFKRRLRIGEGCIRAKQVVIREIKVSNCGGHGRERRLDAGLPKD